MYRVHCIYFDKLHQFLRAVYVDILGGQKYKNRGRRALGVKTATLVPSKTAQLLTDFLSFHIHEGHDRRWLKRWSLQKHF